MYGIEFTPEHPIDRLADLAQTAEAAGFDAAFASSHYFNRDPIAALTRIARETDEIRVGTAAANPYEIHPVTLASQLATLQEASGGRAIFGVGPGDESALGSLGIERERPLRRVLETFRVARELWDGERVRHNSTFTARDAGLEYDVAPLPVYVAAQGPHMIRMGAKHADGLLLNASHPRDLAWAGERVEEGVAERDDGVEPDVLAYASVSISPDAEAARSLARQPVAFVAAGAPTAVLERHGLDVERAEQIGDALERGDFREAFDAVSQAMVDALSVAGTPEDVAERVRAMEAYVDGVVVGTPLGPDLEEAVQLAADALGTTAES